jgi:hypothetical protein
VTELLELARHAGATISELNARLDSGLTLGELVDVVAAKLFRKAA